MAFQIIKILCPFVALCLIFFIVAFIDDKKQKKDIEDQLFEKSIKKLTVDSLQKHYDK